MTWELIAFISASIAVSAGCLAPARWLPPLPNDKLMHFGAFAGLAFLAARIAENSSEQLLWLCGLVAASWFIEVLQNLVPGRKFCWRDMAANMAGIVVATLFSLWMTQL